MLIRSVALASAALAASALAAAPQLLSLSKTRDFNLSCPGCPLLLRGPHGVFRVKGAARNHLELHFDVAPRPDGQPPGERLLVDGYELFPHADPFGSALTAAQIPDLGPFRRLPASLAPTSPQLGFGLHIRPPRPLSEPAAGGAELIVVELQVIEVGTSFVDGIPNLEVKLVRSPAGLRIASVDATESKNMPPSPMHKQTDCSSFLCRWRALLAAQVAAAAKKKPYHHCTHHAPEPVVDAATETQPEPEHPEPMPHHHLHHHHDHHTWNRLFKSLFSHILVPILIGIVAGVFISLIGMALGTMTVLTCRAIGCERRCGRRGSPIAVSRCPFLKRACKAKQDVPPEPAEDNEKVGLGLIAEELNVPPPYRDDPDDAPLVAYRDEQ